MNVVTLERLSIEQYLAEYNQTRTVLCLRKATGEIYRWQALDLTVINRPKVLYDIVKDMIKHYLEYEYFVHPIRAYALDTDFELPIRDDKFKNKLFSSNVSLSEAMDYELRALIDDFSPQE
ncbi:hypothetical protein LNP18_06065 [Leuconostoc citreum]|uniref:hypothetical protein n=1 Tax=Leuconostoc citreum TaxID=33964 RepID=UPI00200A4DE9|nr:hypothetical protein [Leuconostoc citreum]MCK8605667.1 hypothetical protein [Leuconostoc citreum]